MASPQREQLARLARSQHYLGRSQLVSCEDQEARDHRARNGVNNDQKPIAWQHKANELLFCKLLTVRMGQHTSSPSAIARHGNPCPALRSPCHFL